MHAEQMYPDAIEYCIKSYITITTKLWLLNASRDTEPVFGSILSSNPSITTEQEFLKHPINFKSTTYVVL